MTNVGSKPAAPKIEAVKLVARCGYRLLGDYTFDPDTGLWHHRRGLSEPPLRLADLSYDEAGELRYPEHNDRADASVLASYLAEGRALLEAAPSELGAPANVDSDFDGLRWFALPSVCLTR